jgi:hypothetical protein
MYGNHVWKKVEAVSGNTGAVDIVWDGRNGNGDAVASGVYVCIVDSGNETAKRKIAVWKGDE